jgi:hypothetical protein
MCTFRIVLPFVLVIFAGRERNKVIAYITSSSAQTSDRSSSFDDRTQPLPRHHPQNHHHHQKQQQQQLWSVPEHCALLDGVNKMNAVMNSDFFLKSPVLKQFYSKLIKMVEIRDSSISEAGKGLFARKAIKANTIISFYPVHALGTNIDQPFTTSNDDDELYFRTTPTSQSLYLHCTDQPIFRRTSILANTVAEQSKLSSSSSTSKSIADDPLFLDVNPNRKLMDGWVSHIINDGATMTMPVSTTTSRHPDTETSMLEYYQSSKLKKNCIHIPFGPSPIIATVTTKKIMKDEELFTTYGGVRFFLYYAICMDHFRFHLHIFV